MVNMLEIVMINENGTRLAPANCSHLTCENNSRRTLVSKADCLSLRGLEPW